MTNPQLQLVATVTVRVPLNAAGSLADGAVSVLERIESVDAVVDADVQRISPGLNDTTVDLRVRVDFTTEDATLAQRERVLADGVGVRSVDRVEAVEPDAPPIPEVG